jgi:HlyD family secretion protein
LEKKYNFNKLRSVLAETQRTILELEQQVVDSEMEFADQKKKLQMKLVESYECAEKPLVVLGAEFRASHAYCRESYVYELLDQKSEVKKDDVVFFGCSGRASEIIGRSHYR